MVLMPVAQVYRQVFSVTETSTLSWVLRVIVVRVLLIFWEVEEQVTAVKQEYIALALPPAGRILLSIMAAAWY